MKNNELTLDARRKVIAAWKANGEEAAARAIDVYATNPEVRIDDEVMTVADPNESYDVAFEDAGSHIDDDIMGDNIEMYSLGDYASDNPMPSTGEARDHYRQSERLSKRMLAIWEDQLRRYDRGEIPDGGAYGSRRIQILRQIQYWKDALAWSMDKLSASRCLGDTITTTTSKILPAGAVRSFPQGGAYTPEVVASFNATEAAKKYWPYLVGGAALLILVLLLKRKK